jgi:hypothetical protein
MHTILKRGWHRPVWRLAVVPALLILLCLVGLTVHLPNAVAFIPAEQLKTPEAVKAELLAVARSHKGEGDPELRIQQELEPYVRRLIQLAPQPPISQRKNRLVGAWHQVWGPYDYRKNDKRGVDPASDADHIYQVVFAEGYYYNVANVLNPKNRQPKLTILLRGEYAFTETNQVNVRFTNMRKLKPLPPSASTYASLPARSEAKQLPGEKKVLWDWLVPILIGKGTLEEVYTDADLRLTYGSSPGRPYLYVLERVTPSTM